MKFKPPVNENYCATIVEIKNIIELENCDNIQSTIIFGNPIIVSKDCKVGDVGVYFPAETQLSPEYMKENNLYRHEDKNKDNTKKGYIEDNRRIRTMKMRQNKSCGLFMSIESLSFCIDVNDLEIGDSFDKIEKTPICNKYIIVKSTKLPGTKKQRKRIKKSKLIEGQFKFHKDTSQFGKNIHMFGKNTLISITYKLHGTSVIISKLLCKKKINLFYKILRFLKIKIVDTEYDNIYASRNVIKNDDMNELRDYTYLYNTDIWGIANERLKEYLIDGMVIYAEVVGYLPNNSPVQKHFDYGCAPGDCEVYIHRITYTNTSGYVFEFSSKQVQDWCKERGLNAVPQLYYGTVEDLFKRFSKYYDKTLHFSDNLLNVMMSIYLEKDCFMCKNKVPAEGIVIRRELNYFDAYKLKSFRFLEFETNQLDKGIENIEDMN